MSACISRTLNSPPKKLQLRNRIQLPLGLAVRIDRSSRRLVLHLRWPELGRCTSLQRPELDRRWSPCTVPPGVPLQWPERSRLDTLRDGRRRKSDGTWSKSRHPFVWRTGQRTAAQRTELLDVGGARFCEGGGGGDGGRGDVRSLLLAVVELKTFEVREVLAGRPGMVRGWLCVHLGRGVLWKLTIATIIVLM